MAAVLWTYAEQQVIRPISENNQMKFAKIAEETQAKDLQELIGFDFYQDLIQNPLTTANAALMDGGNYTVSGINYFHEGLKYVLAYLFFARYLTESENFDTFVGLVHTNIDNSQRLSAGDQKNYILQFRQVAYKYWEETEQFILNNLTDYPYYYGTNPKNHPIGTSGNLPRRCGCWDDENVWTL